MLDLYKIACKVFKREKKSKKHWGWKKISKEFDITEYQARVVRHIVNLFHKYGATIEDFETKYVNLKNKIKLLEHKYKQVIRQNGENEDIYNLIKETLEKDKDKYFNFETYSAERKEKNKDKEDLVLLISDWHIGEKVDPEAVSFINEFDEQIAEERVKNFLKKL